ncbi:release factor glutamine methyltransferase [Carnobacterium iners]|uniref:Release factor glutamine methyltransferase n=1 Tax=Carnobacterium iners TaxID=1073423 RepID=A0A1X7N5X3_9LACT|nr:peptide chain release factor N(5)-glutamine methyltransferase [Carnobacterium iners]SEK44727.1 release factor glutamine methyltransferase [Carnobacterium iners]SMH32809.1 release factor glutamine methyltransferase [Carnobacterium iners]
MNSNKTYREVLNWASSFLEAADQEKIAAEILIRERLEWSKTDFILQLDQFIAPEIKKQWIKDIKDFSTGIPLQYLLGYEWFFDEKFKVTSDTLIPRPETEEIVDKFLKEQPEKALKVLDIGTGTGVIAITIKKKRPQDEVTAIDLSKEALIIAKENGRNLRSNIRFLLGDLTEPVKNEQFDVVISNPPYIGMDEKKYMDDSVLNYEPELALFAENDGLAVYQRLSKELPAILKPDGQIYLEIGFKQGLAVKTLFQEAFPRADVSIEKDMSGQDRLLKVKLQEK